MKQRVILGGSHAPPITFYHPMPDPKQQFADHVAWTSDAPLKLAKKYTGRSKLVAFAHAYHGDTHGSLSVTVRSVYQDPFRPLLPNVEFLPFDDIDALDAIDDETAAVITGPSIAATRRSITKTLPSILARTASVPEWIATCSRRGTDAENER